MGGRTAAVDKRPLVGLETRNRSKTPAVRQQAGCWAGQRHPPPAPISCGLRSCRQLEQIDDVGENDQAYDGKEHQNENIQHDGVLGRGGLWIAGKCEL